MKLPAACKFLTVAQIDKLFHDEIYDLSGSPYSPLGCEYDMYSDGAATSNVQVNTYIRFTWYPGYRLRSASQMKDDGFAPTTVHGHTAEWNLEVVNGYYSLAQLQVKTNGGVLIIEVQADSWLVSDKEMKSFLATVFALAAPHVG